MDNITNSLHTLHIPGMASCWKTLNETHQLDKLSLSDGLELLLQSELDSRRSNRIDRLEGHELKFFEKMEHLDLLIIDDFGMKRLEGQQQNDFEQIIDDRYHKKSLILSSQLAVADWYGVFSNEMLAEACLDRIVHKSLRFELNGDSMRKKY